MASNLSFKDFLAITLYILAMIALLLLTAPPDSWCRAETTDIAPALSQPLGAQEETNAAAAA